MEVFSLTIGAFTAARLIGTCVPQLNDLIGKYMQARITMSSMSAECSAIQAQLCEVQRYTSEEPDLCDSRLALRPELRIALGTLLTSCMVTFSILDLKLKRMLPNAKMNVMGKFRLLWEEASMKGLLQQMRAHSVATTRLSTAIQWYT